MKWAIQAKEEEKNKPQTFRADGWTGNQRSSQMWWRNEQELLYPEPRTEKTSELNGSGGGRGKGIRGARPFVPVGGTNRDKRGDFCPGWWFQPGQKATRAFCPGWNHQPGQKAPILSRLVSPTGTKLLGPLIPFPLPTPEPFSSLVLAVLGSGEGNSCSFLHHICEDLWFPVHPSALKVWGLFFSSSLACIAHFML